MKVAVIGAAGKMGKWFVNQLVTGQLAILKPEEIAISDTNTKECIEVAEKFGISSSASNVEAVRQADIVIVSVPIEHASAVVVEIAPNLKSGSLLMDITSVKTDVCRTMKREVPASVELISCHPVFGPRFENFAGLPVILIRLRSTLWYPKIKEMFESFGAKLMERTVREHDRIMAIVQGLTHFTHIVSSATIAEMGVNLRETEDLASPPYEAFLAMMFRITHEDPGLYAHIQVYNPYVKKIQSQLIERAKAFRSNTRNRDIKKMVGFITSAGDSLSHNEASVESHIRKSQIVSSALEKERKKGISLVGKKICLRETKTGRIHCGVLRGISSDKMKIEETKRRTFEPNMFKYEVLDEDSALTERKKLFGETKRDFSAFFNSNPDPAFLVEITKKFVPNLTAVYIKDVYKVPNELNRVSICIRVHFPGDETAKTIEKQVETTLTKLGGVLR